MDSVTKVQQEHEICTRSHMTHHVTDHVTVFATMAAVAPEEDCTHLCQEQKQILSCCEYPQSNSHISLHPYYAAAHFAVWHRAQYCAGEAYEPDLTSAVRLCAGQACQPDLSQL
jgi:hypothetical protein